MFNVSAAEVLTTLHAAICFAGFAISLARLRIVLKSGTSTACRVRWWAWVGAHTAWAIGFAYGFTSPGAPDAAAWFIRIGLLVYLVLRAGKIPDLRSAPEKLQKEIGHGF